MGTCPGMARLVFTGLLVFSPQNCKQTENDCFPYAFRGIRKPFGLPKTLENRQECQPKSHYGRSWVKVVIGLVADYLGGLGRFYQRLARGKVVEPYQGMPQEIVSNSHDLPVASSLHVVLYSGILIDQIRTERAHIHHSFDTTTLFKLEEESGLHILTMAT